MPTPFPGMDPYLERPSLWLDVHNSLIASIRDALTPLVAPRYVVALEQRTYIEGGDDVQLVGVPDLVVATQPGARHPQERANGPDAMAPGVDLLEIDLRVSVEVREWFLEVRSTSTGRVVTILEVLSPANKRPGKGRALYLRKREKVLNSRVHLVEVDLLRGGERMPLGRRVAANDYRVLVSRAETRPRAHLYLFGVRQPVPALPVPLRRGDQGPTLELNEVLHALYDRARFDLRIDYQGPAEPPLNETDAAWARALIDAHRPS